jgi:hypothetical protein
MPRANRHYIPGCVWHITHKYHMKEFLLKFARDRRRCIVWLFEAKKRYGLCILNYISFLQFDHQPSVLDMNTFYTVSEGFPEALVTH